MRSSRILIAATALALFAPLPAGAAAQACPGSTAQPAAAQDPVAVASMLCGINAVRSAHHLRPLKSEAHLERAASGYANAMVARRFFAHVDPAGRGIESRAKAAGFLTGALDWALGENLAWGAGSRALPDSTVIAWMASPGHRANILEPNWTSIGVGVATGNPLGGTLGATWAVEFGDRTLRPARPAGHAKKHRTAKRAARHALRRTAH